MHADNKQFLALVIKRTHRASDRDWFLCAERAVRVIARRKEFLTSDDVWEWLKDLDVSTPDNRAMGSVFLNAARDRVIQPIQQWEISKRPACHMRPVRKWKSLVI